MLVRSNEEAIGPEESAATGFLTRLREYSRTARAQLETENLPPAKIVGLSAAACAALSAHQSAEAAIRYSGPINVFAGAYSDFAFSNATFDIDGLANFGVTAGRFSAYYLYGLRQVGFGTIGATQYGTAGTATPGPKGEQVVFAPGNDGNNQPDRLAAGVTIDANSPWFAPGIFPGNVNKAVIQANNYYPYSAAGGNNWPNPAYPYAYTYGSFATGTGFAGIRFNTAGGNAKHNGWVRLRLINNDTGGFVPTWQVGSIIALDWAYETTPDAPITVPGALDGDYNGDGVVDAADYTVYRDAEGLNFPLFNRDASVPGAPIVDGDEYAFWVSNFGATGGAPGSAAPEPGAATILSLGLLATGASGVRRQRRAQRPNSGAEGES